jgi:radical SAM superfamily enzyme YgiQ (UPF0313 family)
LNDVPVQSYLGYKEDALHWGLWQRAYLSASRGCTYHCTFCAEHPFWKKQDTFRSAESVIREMREYQRRFKVTRFYFYDDTLTDWKDLPHFCEQVRQFDYLWSCSTRIDAVEPELLSKMASSGCREIAFGLESGSEKTLQKIEKGLEIRCTRDEVGRRIRLCRECHVTPRAHFIVGFPWEEKEDILATARFAVWLRDTCKLPDANFFELKIYPGTLLSEGIVRYFDDWLRRGLHPTDFYDSWSIHDCDTASNEQAAAKLRRFNDVPRVPIHPHLSSLSLRRLVRNAYEIFFGGVVEADVEARLWHGVAWKS